MSLEHSPSRQNKTSGGGASRLLSVREVAAELGCGVSTVWRHVSTGVLPAPLKIGGMSRWEAADLDAVVERAKAARNGEAA